MGILVVGVVLGCIFKGIFLAINKPNMKARRGCR